MSTQNGPLIPPLPGDRPPPPAGRLARPPSARFEGAAGAAATRPAPSAVRALVPAIAIGALTALGVVLVGGVLAQQSGLLAISGIGGAVLGLLAANAAVSSDGLAPPALSRSRTARAAIGLALLAVAAGALGTWAYGRLEGGVLDPLTYLWETSGLSVPAQAVIASLAAAWGVRAGPVRGGG